MYDYFIYAENFVDRVIARTLISTLEVLIVVALGLATLLYVSDEGTWWLVPPVLAVSTLLGASYLLGRWIGRLLYGDW